MVSLASMPSTTSVLSTYTAFAAAAMLIRTVISEVQTIVGQFIPQKFQDKIIATLAGLFGNLPNSQMTLIIDESDGLSTNEVYQASELYLSSRITSSIDQLKVSKSPRQNNFSITINKGEKLTDEFEGMQLRWEFCCSETKQTSMDFESYSSSMEVVQHKSIQLSFHKQYTEKVLGTYLPYVVQRSKAIVEENKVVKLHALGHFGGEYATGPWSSVIFEHPSTFDTLAMDPMLKKELIADLDRFVKRKEFYGRVGKAWKRGYLLYGPPGTGKSSLIAAMANYLKFDIYDLELTYLQSNSELRRLLVSTANRSIIVIEDIDCSIELKDRQDRGTNSSDSQLTLSGLLNFIDGLWSSCGDERIIVFTTNYKDKLDPALLRPGRMDMHVHMSFCTPCGFKTLAHNYLKVTTHHLFSEIEELIKDVDTTPAEIAEELMKNEDADIVLEGLVKFLKKKKEMNCSGEANVEETKENNELEE
ncbi:PREDICTED: probable mitochondrial chaperone BCS1-B [Fragaria vesca subsp. vesca]|uniref:probable mitochondrial chaperone BCS1-B n=1 Tax=Fragaria vesca subsp. vesca TaxID=101020 RepID=UPI0002C36B38|nr:PREDICTED: probable mitochondrial chaperone BCS1-B [Fragaria vesca subsp. vesca]